MLNRFTETIAWRFLRKIGLAQYLKAIYWAVRIEYEPTVLRKVGDYTAEFVLHDSSDYYRVRSLIHEEDIIRCLLRESEPDDVVFDIGGNIGTHACFVGNKLESGKVVAFEPSPNYTDKLIGNMANNTEYGAVLQLALADENGYTYVDMSGNGGDSIGAQGQVIVPKQRAETLIKEGIISAPDVLKIDVEGAEFEVIKGFGEYLSHVRTIICEIHPSKLKEFSGATQDVERRLQNEGFEIIRLGERDETYHIMATQSSSKHDERCS